MWFCAQAESKAHAILHSSFKHPPVHSFWLKHSLPTGSGSAGQAPPVVVEDMSGLVVAASVVLVVVS